MKQSFKIEVCTVLAVLVLSLFVSVRSEASQKRSNSVVTVRMFSVPTGWIVENGKSIKVRKLAESGRQYR